MRVLVHARLAANHDIPEIQKLDRLTGLNLWSMESYRDLIEHDETFFQLAVSPNERELILGFVLASRYGDDFEILKIAVHPDHQGEGIGQLLLDQGIDQALASGCRSCFLEVRVGNERAIAFYRRNGFEPISSRKNYYVNPTEDALVMRKKLAVTG